MPRFFLSARCSTGTRSPCAICCVDACTCSLNSGANRPSALDSNDPRDFVMVMILKQRTQGINERDCTVQYEERYAREIANGAQSGIPGTVPSEEIAGLV